MTSNMTKYFQDAILLNISKPNSPHLISLCIVGQSASMTWVQAYWILSQTLPNFRLKIITELEPGGQIEYIARKLPT